MPKNLVIVESPAKAKTIEKFLGKDYQVLSSYGHIRDLHKTSFSIDVDNNFQPIYEIPEEKEALVKTLRQNAKKADTVWLASDEDREGEAIAWHLYEVLGLTPEVSKRIVFHEITKKAILEAIENPRGIDLNRVDAQQARRVLDRIVGFELSPVLWKKIKSGLSAGRVQSVAVKLIVEREKEIEAFKSEEYYRVSAEFVSESSPKSVIKAELSSRLSSKEEALQFLESCKGAIFRIEEINVKEVAKSPAPPFTTSTLQQEANRKLGFPVSLTMSIAQRLYEAGHITYMRTDSLNLSSLAIGTISEEIKSTMGSEYLKVRKYHTHSKGAQEAHEAIRPTYINVHEAGSTVQEKKLYNLIWKRTIASQMSDAVIEKTGVQIGISTRNEHFNAQGEVVKFDGFLKVYMESVSEDDNNDETRADMLPQLTQGEELSPKAIDATMRFTQQPPRYNEASLVRKMEELGIGRPSTYAPTISTIIGREYVQKGEKEGEPREYTILQLRSGKIKEKTATVKFGAEKGKLLPTDTGIIVNDFLQEYFPLIMDYNFTAKIEEQFDEIAEGKQQWNAEIAQFYASFHPEVEKIGKMRFEHKVGERILGTDPKTGKTVSVKIGRFGPLVQIGSADSEEKPQFASLLKGQSVNTITLEEALELFKMPRNLGKFEDAEVTVAIGRFGPYIRHAGKFISIPAGIEPQSITIDEACELIMKKREEDNNRIISRFDDEPELLVLNGRYGPYISYNKTNYKIAKGTDAASLTLEQCREIIAKQDAAPVKKSARRTVKSKTTRTKK